MALLGYKTAKVLDDTAAALMTAGRRVAGEKGERAAAVLVNTTTGALRDRCNTDCTRCDRGICDGDTTN